MSVYLPAVAPSIKEGPQAVSVHVSAPVVLECVVSGVPAPRVTWRKHGSVLAGNDARFAAYCYYRSVPRHSGLAQFGWING